MTTEISIKANGRALSFVGTMERYLTWYRDWDSNIGSIYHAAKDLPQGALCVDAGANIGIIALTLAVQRPDCRIIAIEPVPDNVECLRRNIQANSITNVEVIEAPLSDRHNTVTMTDNGPWSSVWETGTVHCRCIPLDDLADSTTSNINSPSRTIPGPTARSKD